MWVPKKSCSKIEIVINTPWGDAPGLHSAHNLSLEFTKWVSFIKTQTDLYIVCEVVLWLESVWICILLMSFIMCDLVIFLHIWIMLMFACACIVITTVSELSGSVSAGMVCSMILSGVREHQLSNQTLLEVSCQRGCTTLDIRGAS